MKDPARKPGIMADFVFRRSLYYLKRLVDQGTQKEVNLNGNGESLLDPDIVDRVRRVKDIMGDGQVQFCTNGLALTWDLAVALKDAGLDRLDVSVHDPYHARRCAHMLSEVGMQGVIADGAIKSSHNWAGQLELEHQVEMQYRLPCIPLMEGRGYINSEGRLSPCCYDYRNLGQFGSVFDVDLLDREIRPYVLCRDCHQVFYVKSKEMQ